MSYTTRSFISTDKEVPSYEKNISICLGTNGFSFSITSVGGELLSFGEIDFEGNLSMSEIVQMVKTIFAEHNITPFGFKKTELRVFSNQFVWVPENLYEAGNDKHYLDAVCQVDISKGVFSEYNDLVKAYLIFTADNTFVSAFKIAIPGLKIRCQHSTLVNETNVHTSDLISLLLINVRKGVSDFTVLCNKKLQFSNSFPCANFEETVYHALNVAKQLHLDDAPLKALLCGDVDHSKFEILNRYFANVDLYNGTPLTVNNAELHHLHRYKYPLLLS